jgi:hypothetical protein
VRRSRSRSRRASASTGRWCSATAATCSFASNRLRWWRGWPRRRRPSAPGTPGSRGRSRWPGISLAWERRWSPRAACRGRALITTTVTCSRSGSTPRSSTPRWTRAGLAVACASATKRSPTSTAPCRRWPCSKRRSTWSSGSRWTQTTPAAAPGRRGRQPTDRRARAVGSGPARRRAPRQRHQHGPRSALERLGGHFPGAGRVGPWLPARLRQGVWKRSRAGRGGAGRLRLSAGGRCARRLR